MKKILFLLYLVLPLLAWSQKDSIYIEAQLNNAELKVVQKLVYHNKTNQPLTQIKLLNFVSAYQSRNTPLLKRKLEDRKKDLYYAEEGQEGKLECLTVNNNAYSENLNTENLFVDIPILSPGASTILHLEYQIHLPDVQFTGYGRGKEETVLKYFFLVPDSFDPENKLPKNYFDLEETANINTYYKIDFRSSPLLVSSNLPESAPKIFEGSLHKDVEIQISEKENFRLNTKIAGEHYRIECTYRLTPAEEKYAEFYLPLHLKYWHDKTGFLPKKIFITKNAQAKNNFLWNDDLTLWKYKFQLFGDHEKFDLDYFSMVSQEIADQLFISDKNANHWISNGLKTYIEIQYLEKYYKDHLLLGGLPQYKILGISPLQYTYASKLKLLDRYGLAYQYIMAQNLDQKIDEPLQKMSNFNKFAISQFETGSLLNFIGEKMGKENFEKLIKGYIEKNQNTPLDKKDFLDQLTLASGYSSAFLEDFIQHKNRINFDLKSYKNEGMSYHIKVGKNTPLKIPFKLETQNDKNEKSSYWYDTSKTQIPNTYIIPEREAQKITINDEYIFPESNYRDNYLYTKGFFNNAKKIKFKFFTDIPDPEFLEVYLSPRASWNNYDKLLVGLKFQNRSLIEQPFSYAFTPYYSTGTHSVIGTFAASYKIQPAEGFYRTLSLGLATSYFHYDFDMAYKMVSFSAALSLNKNPRSQIARNLSFSYSHFDKELNEKMRLAKDYASYNLWNLGFVYSENGIIKDKYVLGNLQLMEDYQKLSAEAYYRWDFAENKKLSLRFFGGVFINNHTRNNIFDFGISRVSNYAFSYNLLAQSASTGILSQQFVIAEGGFKSFIKGTANQFVFSSSIDTHAWKMFNVYADFGVYKNKYAPSRLIWDSGVKLKVVPEFIEIYFPIQSSLGFEPRFNDYKSRIRYTLNLNLNAIIGYFRRGWF